ncbi:MAG TPA: aldolase/citrate lyase family protein [Lapillicoccus sp.]|nr:aldolase/citrate lyase family protein [Lapillicoccus sp.]
MSSLKSRLQSGDHLVGALVRMPCEEVVEMLAVAGMDFVLIDCEHGPADTLALRSHIALAQVHGVPVLVRPGEREPATILRALDHGAQGIVAPHIDSAQEARDLVGAAHYPPVGHRGFATYPRAGRFGTVSADAHRAAAVETLVVAMLESPGAATRSAEILGVPGIDGYLIGVADLAASTGAQDPSFAESVAAIHRGAAEVGSWRAELAGSEEDAERVLDAGARLVVYNVAQVLMRVFAGLGTVSRPPAAASRSTR